MLQFSNSSRVMESRDHFKNGASSKSLMNRGNDVVLSTNKCKLLLVIAFAAIITSCGSGGSSTPIEVSKKLLNALVKKDFKTAASFLYTYGTDYTVEINAKLFEDDFSYFEILKYEIQDEKISADGQNATVTFKFTYKETGNNKEELQDHKFQLIKTESDGWMVEGDGRRLF